MFEEQITKMSEELLEMQAFAEDQSAEEQAELLEIRLTKLHSYMARSGRLLTEAKYIRDLIKQEIYEVHFDKIVQLKPAIVKSYVDTQCVEVNRLINGLERLNHDFSHIQRGVITQISYEKKQMDFLVEFKALKHLYIKYLDYLYIRIISYKVSYDK